MRSEERERKAQTKADGKKRNFNKGEIIQGLNKPLALSSTKISFSLSLVNMRKNIPESRGTPTITVPPPTLTPSPPSAALTAALSS